ncbi:NmrA family transcriptional regulator [Pedobacter yonginense]|uniref:NmrA family transcriptional regulator n=1 Tax=Pedobacter yonginense TaxID=651869 RepID=A0A317EHL0_9SPHI|nr:NAD(P)H-binding protein [Pedobacter yonginense]PWS26142.1 NmrA family transcriptional regulator [Pedobacter yonginense]
MENTKNETGTILVLGANGKTGRRISSLLKGKGMDVRSGSRHAEPKFDWVDDSTWPGAVENIISIYISYQPDLAVPRAIKDIESFVEMAKKTGVKKLVLLSGRGEKEAEQAEQVVVNSGLEWTILRASWFNQNFSEGYLLDPILAGYVALPAGEVKEPFIDVDDIADVAVAALTESGHVNRLYELTGPRLLSFNEAVNEIAIATDRKIHYEKLSLEAYKEMLAVYEIPKDQIDLIGHLFSEVLDGRNASIADGVFEALGRPAKDFSEFAQSLNDSGIWTEVPDSAI